MLKYILAVMFLALPASAGMDELETVIAGTTIGFDVFHDLPCGEGPHTVYDMLLVECRYDGWAGPFGRLNGKPMCQVFDEQKWTDWPRCGGRILTPLELMIDDAGLEQPVEIK